MKSILLNISLKRINHDKYELKINNKKEDCDELRFDQISTLCRNWTIIEIIWKNSNNYFQKFNYIYLKILIPKMIYENYLKTFIYYYFHPSDFIENLNSDQFCLIEEDFSLTYALHINREKNENTNFRRPIMYPDNDGHITEYTQIKLSSKQNALLDRKYWEFLKQHKFILDKENNIIEEISKEYLLELLYPEAKLANIRFKNGYPFDLRECNIKIV
ncbi:9393_t:CDS:2 [Racocetra fulgida]|uniref:9393_t:CDS:1 n=1 Tax=Racocetra fulgida TaxID=60492 RepID=A0A9N9NJG4_9GLOM|nr:9393_t:CDS:2 [Racocetra fulgida]